MDNLGYFIITMVALVCLIVIGGIIVNILGLIVVSRPEMKSSMNFVLMGKVFFQS